MGGSLKKDFVYLTFVRKHCWVGFFIWFVLSFVCFGLFVLHEQLRPYSSRFLWFSPVISSGCPRFSQQEGTSQQLLLYAHSWTICNTNCWGGCHQHVISECSWAELNEAPAETKPIICQNSKPWSRFRKVQMIFQASIQNPPKQPKPKQLPTLKHPDGWRVQPRTAGNELTNGVAEQTWMDPVPLPGSLVLSSLLISDALSWPYQKMFHFLDVAVIWFPAVTRNVFDISPANNLSGSFNYLENLNILRVNWNSLGLNTRMTHSGIFKDPRVNTT